MTQSDRLKAGNAAGRSQLPPTMKGLREMIKATKATLSRLKKMGHEHKSAEVLYEIVKEAAEVDEALKDFPNAAYSIIHHRIIVYNDDGLYIAAPPYEKPYLRGLQIKYEDLIYCAFTHGLNECVIKDINKPVREMLTA